MNVVTGDFIVFKNWPENFDNFNKAYIDFYYRKVKLINTRIKKAVKIIKEIECLDQVE